MTNEALMFFFLPSCAVITEFARDVLAQRGVKLVVPGEKEKVVVSLSEEKNEADSQMEEENGAEEPAVTATVGEKCDVRGTVAVVLTICL